MPKRLFGRIAVIPRAGASAGTVARLIFEMQLLRFLLPLLPFVVAMLVWRDLALPISQAPVAMVLAIAFFEMKVLALSPDDRKALISDAEMARGLDALRFNGERILTRIAARRGAEAGTLLLVVEQSGLARVTPLTLVSVQQDGTDPRVLDLDAEERAILQEELFEGDLTERLLHRITLRRDETLHTVSLDPAGVSAHARMAALIDRAGPAAAGA